MSKREAGEYILIAFLEFEREKNSNTQLKHEEHSLQGRYFNYINYINYIIGGILIT